jgi:hypothetical protein
MAFNRLFLAKTGFSDRPGPGVSMLNNREFFPDRSCFSVERFTGMIIDRKSASAGWAGLGPQGRERGG